MKKENKVFSENLPRWGKGEKGNEGTINWKNSIGKFVDFTYEDIQGEVEIVDYEFKGQNLYIKYLDKEPFKIKTGHFLKGKLGNLLGVYTKKYKYEITDTIKTNTGYMKILKQIKIKDNKYGHKGYNYQCLTCGNIDNISEYDLIKHKGCNVCCNPSQKVLKGYNDIWTTNPNLAKLLANPEDGYKYMQNSGKKTDFKCPDCGNIIKNKSICMINNYKLSCPKCGDGIPYTEKIIYNILEQLNIDFMYQLNKFIFKWCKDYKYDFYIENNSIIIETHGIQHYEESPRGRLLEEEQENDRLKKVLALQNNIKEENYIVIDCRYSDLKFIKNNIIQSKLNELFDLSKIDWIKCHKYALSSLVKKACDLWNSGIRNTVEIGKILKLNRNTINKYLKKGTELGWCDYNAKLIQRENAQNVKKSNMKKVICLNDKQIFNSIKEAESLKNVKGISNCCQGKSNFAGKDLATSEPLHWMYYEDYLKLNENNSKIN